MNDGRFCETSVENLESDDVCLAHKEDDLFS